MNLSIDQQNIDKPFCIMQIILSVLFTCFGEQYVLSRRRHADIVELYMYVLLTSLEPQPPQQLVFITFKDPNL